jgi:ferredoxin-NADP reductase
MAEVCDWRPLSEAVAILRLKRLSGETFPDYKPGQNVELYRDETTMIFSIVSAPFETRKSGVLEFFVRTDHDLQVGDFVECADSASGDFTLDRAVGFRNVIFVATGTGIAPFVSMIRQLSNDPSLDVRYTLIHGSRNLPELGYDKELAGHAAAGKLDFIYIPTISRPSPEDWDLKSVGKGRAGNVLRRLLGLPLKGEAVLPESQTIARMTDRFEPESTIILACGSHASVNDIKNAAGEKKIRFEKEDW